MIRIIFISLLVTALISACSGDESKLKGKWKLLKEENSQGKLIDPKISEIKDVTYEFHDRNRYSKQGIVTGNGDEKLVTNTGEWELSTLKDKATEVKTLQLILREERLEGVLEMKFQIDTISEDQMIWVDTRNNQFYFSNISE